MRRSCFLTDLPNHPRRIANDDCIRRYVFRHHTSRAHDRMLPNHDLRQDGRAGANRRSLLDERRLDFPVARRLQFAGRRGGAWIGVVDEHDAMADEDVILDRHALTDERMARDLAAAAYAGVLLDLDEGAD